jgi:hypothetical protein
MTKKVDITLTHARTDALVVALQSITKQTATVVALTEIVATTSDAQADSEFKKVVLTLPAGKVAALAKALTTVPKQTKMVEKLKDIVTIALVTADLSVIGL